MENLLKTICQQTDIKETVKARDLELNKVYPVTSFKAVQTCYGRNIIADLGEFIIFMPKRFSASLTDEVLKSFENESLAIVVKEIKKVGNNRTPVIEIKQN